MLALQNKHKPFVQLHISAFNEIHSYMWQACIWNFVVQESYHKKPCLSRIGGSCKVVAQCEIRHSASSSPSSSLEPRPASAVGGRTWTRLGSWNFFKSKKVTFCRAGRASYPYPWRTCSCRCRPAPTPRW